MATTYVLKAEGFTTEVVAETLAEAATRVHAMSARPLKEVPSVNGIFFLEDKPRARKAVFTLYRP